MGTTLIVVTILLILSILFSRVTVNVLVFVLRVVFDALKNTMVEEGRGRTYGVRGRPRREN